MTYTIFNLILAIADVCLIEFYLSKNFISLKESQKKISYIITITLMLLIHMNIDNNLCYYILLIPTIIISIQKYSHSKKELLKFLILFLILDIFVANLIILLLSWVFDISVTITVFNWSLTYNILVETIIRYLQLIIILYVTNKNTKQVVTLHHFKTFSILLSFYFAIVLVINNDKLFIFPNVGRTFVLVIIVYNIALIFFDRFQTHHEELEYDHEQLKSESSSDSLYFEEYVRANNEVRGIRHDMKNHLLVLSGYIKAGEEKEALKYIESIHEDIDCSSSIIHTGIVGLDSIIDNKVKTMTAVGITFKEQYRIINIGSVYGGDLALLLGAALDNAIEAAIQSEDKKISLQLCTEANYLCITLINSIKRNTKPNFKKSSKADGKRHGFGYKKIKNITKKYDGDLFTEIEVDKVIMSMNLKID